MIYYKFFNPKPIYYFCEIDYIHKTEQFKPIVGYEGIYEVSDLGRIKSVSRVVLMKNKFPYIKGEKIMKPYEHHQGYLMATLHLKGIKKVIDVHKILAITFLNHKTNRSIVIDHFNNIKTDNRLLNIQLITNRENCSKDRKRKDSIYTGVRKNRSGKKWCSRIHVNGKTLNLGTFNTEIEAHNAYQLELLKI